MVDGKVLGGLVKMVRKARNITQHRTAREIGVHSSVVSRLERGVYTPEHCSEALRKIITWLWSNGVSVNNALRKTQKKKKEEPYQRIENHYIREGKKIISEIFADGRKIRVIKKFDYFVSEEIAEIQEMYEDFFVIYYPYLGFRETLRYEEAFRFVREVIEKCSL